MEASPAELPSNVPNKGCVVIREREGRGEAMPLPSHIVKGQVLGWGAGWECEQNFGDDCGIFVSNFFTPLAMTPTI